MPKLIPILCTLLLGGALAAAEPVLLPARFVEHRIFVTAVTEEGQELAFFTDSGGGLFIIEDAVQRLGLEVLGPGEVQERFGVAPPPGAGRLAVMPQFREDGWIPPVDILKEAFLLPVTPRERLGKMSSREFIGDGMLGQRWHADRVWTFDYPRQKLLLHPNGVEELPEHEPQQRLELGFRTDEQGNRLMHFPRMQICVDGQTLDMLLDTGATTILTGEALEAIGDGGAAVRATGFIAASVFERWRENNPDWRVIENAERESGEAMIEARDVVIAGHRIDAVWFTRRPDENFHDWMSQWMDRRIDGAVGGNALRHFRITIDYPAAVAVFEPESKPRDEQCTR